MSVNYGGNPYGGYGGGSGGYAPPGRVNFGWIGESWQIFGRAAGIWILAVLLYGIVTSVANQIFLAAFHNPAYVAPPSPFGFPTGYGAHYGANGNLTPGGQVISGLFSWVFGSFQSASLYHLAVKQVRGEPVTFADAFGGGPYFLNMLALTLLSTLALLAGFVALCVGMLVVGAFLWPTHALVADGRGALDALSLSVEGMKKDWLNGALLVLVFSLVMLVSLVPCGLGLFVTLPMLYVMSALAYRDMVGMPNLAAPTVAGYGTPAYGAPGVWPPPPGAAPPAPSFGQPPYAGPPPIQGQPNPYGQPPPNPYAPPVGPPPPNPYAPPPAPPRTTLGGDDIDNKGDVVPPPPPAA